MDISAPECEEEKNYMREHAQAKSGQSVPLPPQVFYDEEYLGVSMICKLLIYNSHMDITKR